MSYPYKVNRTVLFNGREYEPGAPIRFDMGDADHDMARRDLLARLAIEDDPVFADNILLREQIAAAQSDAATRIGSGDPRYVFDTAGGNVTGISDLAPGTPSAPAPEQPGEARTVLSFDPDTMTFSGDMPDTRIATPPAPTDPVAPLADPVTPLTPVPLTPPPSPAPATEPVPLGRMKKSELIAQAAREQVEIADGASVQEIIAAIEAKRAAA
ncbi:hypothetical protein [Sphingomonas sp. Marseille-Q8236]